MVTNISVNVLKYIKDEIDKKIYGNSTGYLKENNHELRMPYSMFKFNYIRKFRVSSCNILKYISALFFYKL